jgi:hypothetical protein
MDRRRAAGKTKSTLTHLNALPGSAPRTKSGQIVWAWPQIQASLDSGRTMHEIWEALQIDGIEMSYGQFRTYIWRIRKRGIPTIPEAAVHEAEKLASAAPITEPPQQPERLRDPLANYRDGKARRQVFDYRPELADPKKLI